MFEALARPAVGWAIVVGEIVVVYGIFLLVHRRVGASRRS